MAFIAKFSQATGENFNADSNGNKPYIGKVLAGEATGSIINGTIFKADGMATDLMYACKNEIVVSKKDGKTYTNTVMLQVIEFELFLKLEASMPAGKLTIPQDVNGFTDETDELASEKSERTLEV